MSKGDPVLVVGGGGLIGTSLRSAAATRGVDIERALVPWGTREANDELRRIGRAFVRRAGSGWAAAWVAGAGVIGTEQSALESETAALVALLDGLSGGPPGTLLLASSAGGVHGGAKQLPIDELSPPAPISPYGENKLRQEHLVERFAEATNSTGIVARISNIYGPGQLMLKPQGLVSHACAATLLRRPLHLYVPLDTLRDYLYVDDCSSILLDLIAHRGQIEEGSTVTKIVASFKPVSVAAILGEIRRVTNRRPPVVSHPTSRTGLQSKALSFRSRSMRSLDDRALTTLPVGVEQTVSGLLRHIMSQGSAA